MKKGKGKPKMNPQSSQPRDPTTKPTPQPPSDRGGLSTRLAALDWPKRLLLLTTATLAALLLTAAIYQTFFQKETLITPITAPTTASVVITKDGLSPATITIKVGTQLTWTNNDQASHQPAADPHPIHSSIPGFGSDTTLLSGDSLSFTFENLGTYTYHDHLDPLNKQYQGTVVVE